MAEEPSRRKSALRVTEGAADAPPINPDARAPSRNQQRSVSAYLDGIRAADRVVLGQAITLFESTRPEHQELARRLLDACLPYTGHAIRVGITGAPGVGKSTFIEALGTTLTARGRHLAVLTIDPSSAHSHGSILGDKTRMPALTADPNAFIRPSPTSGSLGGVTRSTRETLLLCEAAGFDTIFVETVGVGQSEVAVHEMVDFFLLLMLAGAGDELQGIKRGIMERADALVITKADGDNVDKAKEARGAYRNALTLFPPNESAWRPRVLTCSALTGEGIDQVWETVEAYRIHTRENGFFDRRRRAQARSWMLHALEHLLREHFYAQPEVQQEKKRLEHAVEQGEVSSLTAAHALLETYRQRR